MTMCSCDFDPPSVMTETRRRARKPHWCPCPHVSRRVAAHERPVCCPAYSEHERCAADLVCAVLRERCERRGCQ